MATNAARGSGTGCGRARADIDRLVAHRIRTRRTMLGITQQQLAGMIGITFQQAHKYETGLHRIASGRLHQIATVLGVEVGYFFEGMDAACSFTSDRQRRLLLRLSRNFRVLNRQQQEALCSLARALVEEDPALPG